MSISSYVCHHDERTYLVVVPTLKLQNIFIYLSHASIIYLFIHSFINKHDLTINQYIHDKIRYGLIDKVLYPDELRTEAPKFIEFL